MTLNLRFEGMKSIIKQEYPEWIKEENMKEIESMCLSDDLDSLFSCIILKEIFPQLNIDGFYNFENIYIRENIKLKKLFGVDIDLCKGRCWGNHVTLLSKNDSVNKDSANINNILGISKENYYNKFCGSTLLQIISYYNYDISNLSDEAKMILLAIDSTFLGYYFKDFSGILEDGYYCKKYLKLLELDCLLEILEKYKKSDFENLNRKYGLKKKIYINEKGKLTTNIDLIGLEKLFNLPFSLPKDNFQCARNYHCYKTNITYKNNKENVCSNMFSCALTYKDSIIYSV